MAALTLPRRITGLTVWIQNSGVLVATDGKRRRAIRAGLKGAADLTGMYAPHGTRVEIELKSKTAKLTDDQRKFGESVVRHGGIYVLYRCTSNDMAAELDGLTEAVRKVIKQRFKE